MRTLTLEVYGDPVPQGSKRALVHRNTGKAVMIESGGTRLRTWRQDVMAAARAVLNGGEAFEGPVQVSVTFYLRQPKKPKHVLPITRPDIDKLTRSILDAITAAGVLWDDSQVATLSAKKRYTTTAPRAHIFINEETA